MFKAPWSCTILTDDSIEASRGKWKFLAFPDLLVFSFIVFSVYDRWLHSWRSNCCCPIGYQGKINSESCWVKLFVVRRYWANQESPEPVEKRKNWSELSALCLLFFFCSSLFFLCCSLFFLCCSLFFLCCSLFVWIENNVIFRYIYSFIQG